MWNNFIAETKIMYYNIKNYKYQFFKNLNNNNYYNEWLFYNVGKNHN